MMVAVPKPKFARRSPKRKYRNNFSAEMKKKIREHFNYTCQECGIYSESVHVHHVKPKGSSNGRAVFSNALTLCFSCHTRVHSEPDILKKWQRWAEERYGRFYFMDKTDMISRFTEREAKEMEEDIQQWLKANQQIK